MAAFNHTGVAARLVHDLKYRGLVLITDLASDALRNRLRPGLAFCPVPRVWTRYVRFGVDPAAEFASRLALGTGGQVLAAIARPIHAPRRAGSRARGRPPSFRPTLSNHAVVLVDDVLTTGSTVSAAVAALGPERVEMVITITSAPKSSDRT